VIDKHRHLHQQQQTVNISNTSLTKISTLKTTDWRQTSPRHTQRLPSHNWIYDYKLHVMPILKNRPQSFNKCNIHWTSDIKHRPTLVPLHPGYPGSPTGPSKPGWPYKQNLHMHFISLKLSLPIRMGQTDRQTYTRPLHRPHAMEAVPIETVQHKNQNILKLSKRVPSTDLLD